MANVPPNQATHLLSILPHEVLRGEVSFKPASKTNHPALGKHAWQSLTKSSNALPSYPTPWSRKGSYLLHLPVKLVIRLLEDRHRNLSNVPDMRHKCGVSHVVCWELREHLVWRQGSQVSMRVARGSASWLSPARLLCPWDSPGKNTGVG